ncbi:MAG: hypothetical protein HY437_00695 [Candidatus Magasanikbacteria bacterium]|nr:hypothetical protein [Candidatus Magasanikbacteria bacterium]
MSIFSSLVSFLLGVYGVAFVGAQILETPPPPSTYSSNGEYSVPAQSCPVLSAQCPFGYVYDNATGCGINECAPDPAIQQKESDDRCVKDQKRSLEDFNRYQIKDGERRIKELVRNKVAAPADVQALIGQMKVGYTSALGLSECQDLNTATQDLYQLSNEFNDKIRDVEDAMNAARCLKDAQRELKDFEGFSIKEVERKIAQAKKQKVVIPEAITVGFAQVKALLAEAKKATECQDLQDAKSEMHSVNNELQDETRKLDFLMQIPQMVKEITREMKDLDRQWKSTKSKAKSSKADLSEFMAKGQQLFDELQALFNEFKSVIALGDIEQIQGFEERGAEAEDKEGELREIMNTVEALRNAPRYIQGLERRMKDTRRMTKNMQRDQKIDTSALDACLTNLQPVLDAAKSASKQRPVDPDAMADAFADMEEGMADCDELSRQLQGIQEEQFFGDLVPKQFVKN